jgi:hypothetical protein
MVVKLILSCFGTFFLKTNKLFFISIFFAMLPATSPVAAAVQKNTNSQINIPSSSPQNVSGKDIGLFLSLNPNGTVRYFPPPIPMNIVNTKDDVGPHFREEQLRNRNGFNEYLLEF